jgi:hypothetical protein
MQVYLHEGKGDSFANQLVQFATLLKCHQIRISSNVLAINKDIGNSLLTGHLEQLLLHGSTIFYSIL